MEMFRAGYRALSRSAPACGVAVRNGGMLRWIMICAVILRGLLRTRAMLAAMMVAMPALAADVPRHPALAIDEAAVRAALAAEARTPAGPVPVSGIGTPHHLLAADLIARAFNAAAGNRYERIVLLSPDHYFKSPRPMATTRRGFDTAFGPVETDRAAVDILLAEDQTFAASDLFDGEHGVTGLMPFVRHLFPDVPVVAVALGIGSTRADWDRATEALKRIVTPATLVIQSTDYSHYLLPHVARARDQQTLNVLSARDLDALPGLHQPGHLDSRAAQYLQLRLQAEVFGAAPAIIGNRTAFEYIPAHEPTTSYVVTAYSPDAAALARLTYADQSISYFGGDVFVGRHFTALLARAEIRDRIVAEIRKVTGGAPLTINLEGAMLEETPQGLPALRHAMPAGLAAPILEALGVRAAGLANNHSHDLGKIGLSETLKALSARAIRPLRHMEVVDMGAYRLVAINFIGVGDYKGYPAARRGDPAAKRKPDTDALCALAARPPLVAFVHWGQEYVHSAREEELALSRDLLRCGVSAVIGAHSHLAAPAPVLAAGGDQVMIYSVGNLIFDQFSTTSSGALAELRVFRHGTFALRMIPLPNMYDLATALRGKP